MASDGQAALRRLWPEGRRGTLSAWGQAKMYALREVWPAEHSSSHGMLAFIAARVQKVGGGNPSGEAIGLPLARMDADADWFPGKSYQESRAKASKAGRSGTMIYA